MSDEGVSRRELLKKAGLGGAVFLGGSVLGRSIGNARAETGMGYEGAGEAVVGDDVLDAIYGHGHGPPSGIDPSALDARTLPPARDGRSAGVVRDLEFAVEERLLEIGNEVFFEAWTYNGTVPGPIIRATEGDLIRIHFQNRTGHAHSLHFHGAHRPEMDGWEPVPAGGETVYQIDAGPAGLHPYHCHTAPLAEHVSRGLYGTMIIDPPEGRPPANEVVLMLSGFSNEAVGRNGIVAWNGIAGFYRHFPIKVPAGELVRAYVLNMLEHEPIGSFHLHAETFDVYPAGMGDAPAFRDDTIALTQGQRAVLEFTLPSYGRYMFHPHQHWLADRGAIGWFAAV